jgi:SAM-dependent methyltransferase
MHESSLLSVKSFGLTYGSPGKVIVDLGAIDDWGINLRQFFKDHQMNYISVDLKSHHSVDLVVKFGEKLPFNDQSVDIVISTSCFEHDSMFWMTFKEICRIVKLDGLIYMSAPTNGDYHCFPVDNWRFYPDAGQALAYWSGYQIYNEPVYPVKVLETFHICPFRGQQWCDFVCVWKRVETKENSVITPQNIVDQIGDLEKSLNNQEMTTIKKIPRTLLHGYPY